MDQELLVLGFYAALVLHLYTPELSSKA